MKFRTVNTNIVFIIFIIILIKVEKFFEKLVSQEKAPTRNEVLDFELLPLT